MSAKISLGMILKGGLHPKKTTFFFVSNDAMKGPESRKFFF